MVDVQNTPQADPPNAPRPPYPPREPQSVLPAKDGTVPRSASGVPITPGDPRFMTRDVEGRLVNPDGSVYVPEEQPRTVHHTHAELASEIEALWHATPSGTESAVVRMRRHLRELRGFVEPDSDQAKASAAKSEEARLRAHQEANAAQAQAAADARAADEVRARQQAAKPAGATG